VVACILFPSIFPERLVWEVTPHAFYSGCHINMGCCCCVCFLFCFVLNILFFLRLSQWRNTYDGSSTTDGACDLFLCINVSRVFLNGLSALISSLIMVKMRHFRLLLFCRLLRSESRSRGTYLKLNLSWWHLIITSLFWLSFFLFMQNVSLVQYKGRELLQYFSFKVCSGRPWIRERKIIEFFMHKIYF
jgi:hypothetical protein